MLSRFLLSLFLVCAAAPVFAADAAARVALVIGNSAYDWQSQLANPRLDANRMAETLERIGFEVTQHMDLGENDLERALAAFAEQADEADVALVYYSGHGMEIGGINYLIPVDARLSRERDARFEAVDLASVRASIAGAKKLKVVILDACRNNTFLPTTRGGSKGLGRIVAQAGEIIAYSTAPGTVTQDGEPGELSPYTRALSERLAADPMLDVRFLFTSLGRLTERYAGVAQRPYTEFAAILPEGSLPLGAEVGDDAEAAFRLALQSGDPAKLREVLGAHPAHERSAEAKARLAEIEGARLGREIDAALRSKDRAALEAARAAAANLPGGHPKLAAVETALTLHGLIDEAVAEVDLTKLDAAWSASGGDHPRRGELTSALRKAVARDACGRLLKYSLGCPPALLALSRGETAAVAPAAPPVPPASAPAAKAPEPPRDPIQALLADASPDSLARAPSIKAEWIQTALAALGHYRGAIDGGVGPATRRAIDAWRDANGFAGAGELSAREIVALMKQGGDDETGGAGRADAGAYLGVMYGLGVGVGVGVDRDPVKSRGLLERAAADGFADARTYLASISKTWGE